MHVLSGLVRPNGSARELVRNSLWVYSIPRDRWTLVLADSEQTQKHAAKPIDAILAASAASELDSIGEQASFDGSGGRDGVDATGMLFDYTRSVGIGSGVIDEDVVDDDQLSLLGASGADTSGDFGDEFFDDVGLGGDNAADAAARGAARRFVGRRSRIPSGYAASDAIDGGDDGHKRDAVVIEALPGSLAARAELRALESRLSSTSRADSAASAPARPAPRYAHQLVADSARGAHWLFGGNPGAARPHDTTRLDDLWQVELERMPADAYAKRALFLLRKYHFTQLCAQVCKLRDEHADDELVARKVEKALLYLQNDVRAVAEPPLTAPRELQALTTHLLYGTSDVVAHSKRSQIELVEAMIAALFV